jgi:signal transduction histidine kinase
VELLGAASGVVALWDEVALTLVPRAWFGPGERIKDLRWKPGEDIPGITEDATHTAALVEPLLYGDRLVGVIRIDRAADQQPFTETDRQFLALFTTQAAIAIENARLYARVVRRSEETASLLRASRSLMAGLDLQETLSRIAEEAARITQCQHVKVLLGDREKQTLRLGVLVGRPSTLLDNYDRGGKESLSAIVVSTGQPLFVADCVNDPRNPYADQDRAEGIVTYLGLPIRMHGKVVGVLTVNTSQPRVYTPEDLEYLTLFADLSAIVIGNARLFEEVRVGREQLWALSRQLVEVQETERHSIARELHDEIGQLLTGLTLLLEMSARVRPEKLKARLSEAQAIIKELMMRVCEMSLDLRPTMLDDLGLLPALLWYFDRYTSRTQIRVHFQHWGLERRFPSEIETATYRIAQEALNNVARHAGVTETTVCLSADEDTVDLRIEDHGAGFDAESVLSGAASSGLTGMRERATLLGGRLSVASTPGSGTQVVAELPLAESVEKRKKPR